MFSGCCMCEFTLRVSTDYCWVRIAYIIDSTSADVVSEEIHADTKLNCADMKRTCHTAMIEGGAGAAESAVVTAESQGARAGFRAQAGSVRETVQSTGVRETFPSSATPYLTISAVALGRVKYIA